MGRATRSYTDLRRVREGVAMARYAISFDFDAEGDAPAVFIIDRQTTFGGQIAEIFEEPVCTAGKWSNNADDWQPGPLAQHILALLNERPLQ
jgi:hypothetical protein